jgi:hypothetical protein
MELTSLHRSQILRDLYAMQAFWREEIEIVCSDSIIFKTSS